MLTNKKRKVGTNVEFTFAFLVEDSVELFFLWWADRRVIHLNRNFVDGIFGNVEKNKKVF